MFPTQFGDGFRLKDRRVSTKHQVTLRRFVVRDGTSCTVRPSFLMPDLVAPTREVEEPLFLREFAVPFWALTRLFGHNPMFWYRLEMSLGRSSIVGTTVRRGSLPEHLLADEHHQTREGTKVYLATTVGAGCVLGVEPAATASTDDLTTAYAVFRAEARDVAPRYTPRTVDTDGWKGTQAAWRTLFVRVVILPCFLHAWLKVRDRGKHPKAIFGELSRRVWEAYEPPNRRSFGQRLRHLRRWGEARLQGVVRAKLVELCVKRDRWSIALKHPGAHRTSNMLDRLMRGMNRYPDAEPHLHGSVEASRQHGRAWALLGNFTPWHPAASRKNQGWRCPAERLNQHRYPRQLVGELVDLRLAGRIPVFVAPKTVTARQFAILI